MVRISKEVKQQNMRTLSQRDFSVLGEPQPVVTSRTSEQGQYSFKNLPWQALCRHALCIDKSILYHTVSADPTAEHSNYSSY